MTPSELCIFLPCHSLEDFPLELTGELAEGLLSAWSALWHPRLLAAAGKMPRWYRADYPPDDVADRLVVIPPVSEPLLLTGWIERAAEQGGVLVRHQEHRPAIVAELLAALDDPQAEAGEIPVDAELEADFLALGFGYLGLELLTRQMRYISNLDEVHLEQQVLAAANAYVASDFETARNKLSATFDVLMEGRERFYPVDAYLLDLTLVAPTTLGMGLRSELVQKQPVNLLISAETLEQMERGEAETLAVLRDALDQGTASLIGGEYRESPLPLVSAEEIRAELARGNAVYERILGRRPQVFGRRTAGLTPSLPQILARSGYLGAIHATLDEGRIPPTGQGKARWQGWDHSSIDAYARTPLDAREPGTFLSLSAKLGETMDLDHVATLAIAHWPAGACAWYDDLRRIHAYVPLFGKFVTVDEFFSQTDMSGRFAKLAADDYQTPYLQQAVRGGARDPISRYVELARAETRRLVTSSLGAMQAALHPAAAVADGAQGPLDETAAKLAKLLSHGGDDARLGTLVLNPYSFPTTTAVATDSAQGITRQAVDVAAMGFAWIDPQSPVALASKKKGPRPLAQELTLANEYLELRVHPETGGISSLHDYRTRGNRLSQQLAFRNPVGDVEYSTMRADQIDVALSHPATGEIVSRGRLLGATGEHLARYEQTLRLVRGSRIAEVNIRLDIDVAPQGEPWSRYYGIRWAWADEGADLHRSIAGASQPTEARRLEAPHYVEIRDDRTRTALLTGGLPFHRRSGERMLDTLLVVAGEEMREFRLGIGVDLTCAEAAALQILGPSVSQVANVPAPRNHQQGWLFRIDTSHVVATHWEPLFTSPPGTGPSRSIGFRVRLLETEGKPGRVRLYACRPIGAARQVDLAGQPLVELRLADDGAIIDVGAFEWLEVIAEWRDA